MTTSETMKAIVLEETGEADKLVYKDVPRPQPGPEQVLVKVKGCGVAYRDIIERRGGHPFMHLPVIQGHEFTGDVIEIGSAVKRWQTGDRVLNLYANSCGACEDCLGADERRCMHASEAYGLFTNGGYAEYAVLHERGLERLHNNLSYEEGACIMSAVSVAYNNVVNRIEVRPGEIVLITGASGGVGMAALQIVKFLGATAWVVTSSENKVDILKEMGADYIFVNDGSSFHREVRGILPQGVDAAIDCVGSATLGSTLKSLKRIGRVAVIGTISPEPLSLKLGTLVVNGLTVKGSDGTSRQAIRETMELVAAGSIRVTIDRTMPLEQASQAHQLLEARQVSGRIVLIP